MIVARTFSFGVVFVAVKFNKGGELGKNVVSDRIALLVLAGELGIARGVQLRFYVILAFLKVGQFLPVED